MFFAKLLRLAALVVAVVAVSVAPALACSASQGGCYGALSAGEWHPGFDGSWSVAIGAAWNYDSNSGAQGGALAQCESRGGLNCAVVGGVFSNGGCGYISSGTDGNGGVNYGTGPTSADAYAECVNGGDSCDPPIGGCTSSN